MDNNHSIHTIYRTRSSIVVCDRSVLSHNHRTRLEFSSFRLSSKNLKNDTQRDFWRCNVS